MNEFREFISGRQGPATIAELAAAFVAGGHVTAEYREAALLKAVKQDLRKAINAYRDADGSPRLISLPDAARARVYKQLDMFTDDDYVEAWLAADGREAEGREAKLRLERHHDLRFSTRRLRDIVRQRLGRRNKPPDAGGQGDLFGQGAA
ncbi:MAG TPA: hypothetical protein VFH56_17145 [Acidimicrobiales bacterium]|nr:hypothetical protein [Acidimicrobiales bacterium]